MPTARQFLNAIPFCAQSWYGHPMQNKILDYIQGMYNNLSTMHASSRDLLPFAWRNNIPGHCRETKAMPGCCAFADDSSAVNVASIEQSQRHLPVQIRDQELSAGLSSRRLSSPSSRRSVAEHLSSLANGFAMLSFAATFVAAIQAQVTSNVMTYKDEDIPLRAVDALFLSGLILDIMSAALAFLTSRWLQRLDADEKDYLEQEFERQTAIRRRRNGYDNDNDDDDDDDDDDEEQQIAARPQQRWNVQRVVYTCFSMSLFVPMPLLVLGVFCMVGGILTAAWSRHPIVVAALVTVSCVATLPFLAGVFLIGQDKRRRRAIITRLSEMQGDW